MYDPFHAAFAPFTPEHTLSEVTIAYDRRERAVVSPYGHPGAQKSTQEVLEISIPLSASVDVTVSSDARGRLRRIQHEAVPTHVSVRDTPERSAMRLDAHELLPRSEFSGSDRDPGEKFVVTILVDTRDEVIHLCVNDVSTTPAVPTDTTIMLWRFRDKSPT